MKNPWHVLRGQERLWVVFWLYCVLGTAVFTWAFAYLVTWLPFDSSAEEEAATTTLFAALAAFVLWAHISLWTSAFNAEWRPWGYAARIYAGVVLAGLAVSTILPYFVTTGPIEVRLIQ